MYTVYKLTTPWISQSFHWLWLSNWRFPFIKSVRHSCHRASWRSNATTCCISITESHSTWWFQPPLFKICSTAWVHLFSSFRRMATYLGSSTFSTQRMCPDPHVPNQQKIPDQRMPTIPDRYLSAKSWWWLNQPNWTICASQNGFIFTKYRWTQKIFELPPRNFRIPKRFGSFPGNSNRNCRGFTASEGHAGLHLETELIHGLIQQKISLLHHPIILCWRFTSDAYLCLYLSICMNYEILPTRFPWNKRRIPDVTNDLLWKKFLILSVTKSRMIPNLSQERSNHDPHFSTFKHFHCCLTVDSTVTALYRHTTSPQKVADEGKSP